MSQIKLPTVTVSMPRLAEGFADGFITVLPDQADLTADLITVYWADREGNRLADYDFLAHARTDGFSFEVGEDYRDITTTYTPSGRPTKLIVPKNRLIPDCACGLIVEAGEAEPLYVSLPTAPGRLDPGKKLFEFQVISDLHLNSDRTTKADVRTIAAFADIAAASPDSTALIICGDMTNHGWDEDFDILLDLVREADGLPPVYYVMGNHDYGYPPADPNNPPYRRLFGDGPLYYDRWINGYHHIFLAFDGIERFNPIPENEMAWLAEKLAEDADPSKPIFVYCHEGIMDTVAGTSREEDLWGITNGEEVGALLAKYPQAIFFSAHSHWEFASLNEIYYADERMCNAVNTACIKHLSTSINRVTGDMLDSSEGVFVEVYEGGTVFIRGRDTLAGKWVGDYVIFTPTHQESDEKSIERNQR